MTSSSMSRRAALMGAGAASLASMSGAASGSANSIRVVVWDERQMDQKKVYPNFIGNHIAQHLGSLPGIQVEKSVGLDDPEHGLGGDTIENCDVIVWWGHIRQGEVPVEVGKKIVERVKSGKLGLISLHASHWSVPFMESMNDVTRTDDSRRYPGPNVKFDYVAPEGRFQPTYDSLVTPAFYAIHAGNQEMHVRVDLPLCVFPGFRHDGRPSSMTVLRPDHPIAQGLPAQFEIPETEAYLEPFHVPEPDMVIFQETWADGGWFRSGMVWTVGEGKVFYFRPGHEIYAVSAGTAYEGGGECRAVDGWEELDGVKHIS